MQCSGISFASTAVNTKSRTQPHRSSAVDVVEAENEALQAEADLQHTIVRAVRSQLQAAELRARASPGKCGTEYTARVVRLAHLVNAAHQLGVRCEIEAMLEAIPTDVRAGLQTAHGIESPNSPASPVYVAAERTPAVSTQPTRTTRLETRLLVLDANLQRRQPSEKGFFPPTPYSMSTRPVGASSRHAS
eukprot:4314972-Pleurochrysis_carterae.AAC.1